MFSYELVTRCLSGGDTWCFAEVFILMGLRGVGFVSVVYARVTGAELVRNCVIWKNGVDFIGLGE